MANGDGEGLGIVKMFLQTTRQLSSFRDVDERLCRARSDEHRKGAHSLRRIGKRCYISVESPCSRHGHKKQNNNSFSLLLELRTDLPQKIASRSRSVFVPHFKNQGRAIFLFAGVAGEEGESKPLVSPVWLASVGASFGASELHSSPLDDAVRV